MTLRPLFLHFAIAILGFSYLAATPAKASEGRLHYDLKRGYYRSVEPVKLPKPRSLRRKSSKFAQRIGRNLGYIHKNDKTRLTIDGERIFIENSKPSSRKRRRTATSVRSHKIGNTGTRIVVIERE